MSPEPSPRVGSLIWMDSVAAGSQAVRTYGRVQPSGQPISHSTNAGLSWERGGEVWPESEDSTPAVAVVWPGRETRQATSFSGRLFLACVSSEASPDRQSRALGVGH
jgi:hypothetical protein